MIMKYIFETYCLLSDINQKELKKLTNNLTIYRDRLIDYYDINECLSLLYSLKTNKKYTFLYQYLLEEHNKELQRKKDKQRFDKEIKFLNKTMSPSKRLKFLNRRLTNIYNKQPL